MSNPHDTLCRLAQIRASEIANSNPNHIPAGSSDGGQFASGSTPGYKASMKGKNLTVSTPKGDIDLGPAHLKSDADFDQPLPANIAAAVKSQGANPNDYFFYAGKPIRKSVSQDLKSLSKSARQSFEASDDGLTAQRKSLLSKISDARERYDLSRSRGFEKSDAGQVFLSANYSETKAISDLSDFDVKYPHIKSR